MSVTDANRLDFPPPVLEGEGLDPHQRLMSGMFVDAAEMIQMGFATPADIDLSMCLGAGYPKGPLACLADLPEHQRRGFGVDVLPQTSNEQSKVEAKSTWQGAVGLIGTGRMASGIAEAILRSRRPVVVLGRSPSSLEKLRTNVSRSLARSVERGRIDTDEAERCLAALQLGTDVKSLAHVDFLIEAVVENLDEKRKLFATLDSQLPPTIAFATNTSSFRVADMASAVSSERVIFAAHFFNPAQAMKLVEIICPPGTPEGFVENATVWVREIGKVPVRCGDQRGFLVNRLLIPFLNDAVRTLEVGATVEEIDILMTEVAGHPMGPFALIDMIGLDVMVFALRSMAQTDDNPRLVPAKRFHDLIAQGKLGRKTGQGFHNHESNRYVR
ncbi:3-hydroxyacyl-CoA dehydrogenase family protein [Pacificibacter marinus]|uniref:3-hydroxyacyl-CoA dehydrogenase family protein n=1 Tax=Pacificibacter marinus TaxID=658057 RepID=UPI001C07782A|nr:3-hydroxyacyl-CoA dehydrogenase family protein [Pacificibacter marinus]MBU2867434.1 NAD(P)-binding domain-containing protein [Pacificibacter marinus]